MKRGIDVSFKNKPRSHYEPKVPPGHYSEHAARVEAALCELEAIVKRLER